MTPTLSFEEFQMTPEQREAKAAYELYVSEKRKADWREAQAAKAAAKAFSETYAGQAEQAKSDKESREALIKETVSAACTWLFIGAVIIGIVWTVNAFVPANAFSIPVTIVAH